MVAMKHREWTPQEKAWVKEHYRQLTCAEMASHLGRSRFSVYWFIQRWILKDGRQAAKPTPKHRQRRSRKCWWCQLPAPVLVPLDNYADTYQVCLECKPTIPPLPNNTSARIGCAERKGAKSWRDFYMRARLHLEHGTPSPEVEQRLREELDAAQEPTC